MNIAVPPPRVLLLQARSVRKHRKPGGVTSVLSISAFSYVSVTAMARRLLFILDFARLLRPSDVLKILRTLHARTFDNVILSGATLRRPAIQPRRRRFRLLGCAIGHDCSLKILMTSSSARRVIRVRECLMRRRWAFA